MWNRNKVGTRSFLGAAQETEEVFGIQAVLVTERNELRGCFDAVGITDHITMQVLDTFCTWNKGGPLPGKEGREFARHVVVLSGIHLLPPPCRTDLGGEDVCLQGSTVPIFWAIPHETTTRSIYSSLQALYHGAPPLCRH